MARRALAICGLLGAIAVAGCVDSVLVPPQQSATSRPSLAVQSNAATRARGRTGRHIVAFTGQVPSAFAGQVTSLGGKVQWVSSGSGLAVVSGLSDAAAATLSTQAGIQEVDLDETISLEMPKLSALDGGGSAPASNDNPAAAARFARQWNMIAVQADVAWAKGFLGSPTTKVYMLDSGIDYLHADLVGRVDLTRSVDLLGTFDTDVIVGNDTITVPFTEADTVALYFPGRAPFTDLFFHGTHTSATVSSNAVRAAGVTSKTTLVAVKVCGYIDECPFSSILNGVIYGADNGADVMNLSLGGSFPRMGNGALIRLINKTFLYAHRKGVTIVVSAGNEATDLDHDGPVYDSFCDSPGVICVSATGPLTDANATNPDPNLARTGPFTDIDSPAYFTNFGRRAIDVAAPGGNSSFGDPLPAPAGRDVFVWAACSQTSLLIGCFSSPLFIVGAQGTSMSAPHVTGTAALLVGRFGRNPDRIKQRIEETADDVATRGTAAFFGHGRINVARAVGALKEKHGGYGW
ncbi:MAG TPA: S8 family serine peptidase [Gemmatimonadales bacterium]|nr:S8 family serine peptidase [Gemmatimonadales bacterium]